MPLSCLGSTSQENWRVVELEKKSPSRKYVNQHASFRLDKVTVVWYETISPPFPTPSPLPHLFSPDHHYHYQRPRFLSFSLAIPVLTVVLDPSVTQHAPYLNQVKTSIHPAGLLTGLLCPTQTLFQQKFGLIHQPPCSRQERCDLLCCPHQQK